MTHIEFNGVLRRRMDRMSEVLAAKAAEYSSGKDRLHNFKRAAAMLGTTPERALLGMFAKHMVSIMDMADALEDGRLAPPAAWDEKLGDAVNYLVLLEGLIEERAGAEEEQIRKEK